MAENYFESINNDIIEYKKFPALSHHNYVIFAIKNSSCKIRKCKVKKIINYLEIFPCFIFIFVSCIPSQKENSSNANSNKLLWEEVMKCSLLFFFEYKCNNYYLT